MPLYKVISQSDETLAFFKWHCQLSIHWEYQRATCVKKKVLANDNSVNMPTFPTHPKGVLIGFCRVIFIFISQKYMMFSCINFVYSLKNL